MFISDAFADCVDQLQVGTCILGKGSRGLADTLYGIAFFLVGIPFQCLQNDRDQEYGFQTVRRFLEDGF